MKRPLSGFEKAFCLSEPLVPINFSLVACFTGELDEAALHTALGRLHERYSMAALRLDCDENGTPWFISDNVSGFPLQVIEQACDGFWQQVAAQELGKNFDLSEGPLIRAVLLKRSTNLGVDLILTFHHGVADGISAVYFLRDLLCLLQGVQPDLPVLLQPPNLLTLIPRTAKDSVLLKAQILGMKSGLWLMRHFKRFGLQFPPADRLIGDRFPWQHIDLISRCLTQAQTICLTARCREEGTTIHAAICAAWLHARLETSPGIKNWKRVISCPVNLRGLLKVENTFGMLMSNAIITADCHPDRNFWEIAREIKIHLNQEIQTGRVYRWILTMIYLMDSSLDIIRQALPAFVSQPVNYDFSISNLGRLNLPVQNGSWKLETVYGPIVNTSEREMTVGVSTFCDHLTLTLTYRDFVLHPIEAEKMADKVINILGQATGW